VASEDYSARHLSVLEGLEAVRKRPGMYIGSTDGRGLMHCLWEIIDNSVDEALAGHGKKVSIELHKDGSVTVEDDGRGVPVDIEPKTGLSGVEVVFTKLHAGGKFGSGSYAASGGLHGVGASVVNALSERLDVEVDRNGQTFAMSFRRGEPGVFDDKKGISPTNPFKPFVKKSELQIIGKVGKTKTGTRVRYWPDPQIFVKETAFDLKELEDRARQTAFLVPGFLISVNDKRSAKGAKQDFKFEGGISEFVNYLAPDTAVTSVWRLRGEADFTETVPVLDKKGNMVSTEVTRKCDVDIALRWGTGYETNFRSFVNVIATPKGGTHVSGFEQGAVKAIRAEIDANSRKLKLGNDKVEKEDILAGLTAVVSVRLAEPQFEGQTKEILGTPAVKNIVSAIVAKRLNERLKSTKREDKTQAALVLEKIVAETKSRVSARTHKETQRRKNALESSSLPSKLVDCRTSQTGSSELFIVEGDSALGTAKLARNSEYQALLPIRGKILNVQKASVSDMLSNTECASILQVIGAGSGRSFELDAARYGKIILMSDADVDGAHIRTLLLTLFFRYMRPLVEAGRVYAAVPPLHRVTVINAGAKANEHIYTYSQGELEKLLAKLKIAKKGYQEPIQRYKGLGEMDAEQLAETTMDRSKRALRRVTVKDAEAAENMFELLMGNEVGPRRDFIIDSADSLERERIDA
jgi:DNA gyrase subunit B